MIKQGKKGSIQMLSAEHRTSRLHN